MKRLVTALLFVVASSVGVLAQSLPVPSYWLNQRGSGMKLYSINPQGMFNGVYINQASGFGCQGTPFAVNGQAVGNRVTFTVIWNNGIQNCNSKTVWRGTVVGRRINTQWILYTPQGRQTGTDLFLQQP